MAEQPSHKRPVPGSNPGGSTRYNCRYTAKQNVQPVLHSM